jgi:hypothetical protein
LLAYLSLNDPFRVISSLVERVGLQYNYVRRVVDELRKNNVVSLFPNYRAMGLGIGVVVKEGAPLPECLPKTKTCVFMSGRSFAPKILNFYMYSFDYKNAEDFLKEIRDITEDSVVLVETPLEEEIMEYFRDREKVEAIRAFSTNPLRSIRDISSELGMPFSTLRYVINRAFSEGIIHPLLKVMNKNSFYDVQQIFVLARGIRMIEQTEFGASYNDVSLSEIVHDIKGEAPSMKMFCVRGAGDVNLVNYVSRKFHSPLIIVSYKLNLKAIYKPLLEKEMKN